MEKMCEVPGCEIVACSFGLCDRHYYRKRRYGDPRVIKSGHGTPIFCRFSNGFIKLGNGCWEWVKAKNSHGYGHFRANGQNILTHRYSWELFKGNIPKKICVLHHCDNKVCVNPDHLFLGTKKDNAIDMVKKNRNRNQYSS